jgi:hypothetical protein
MALEALDGKIVFSEGSGGICGSFELLEALARTNRGSCEDWNSEIFGGFLECLTWLGPNHKYFSKTEGPVVIFPNV